MTMKAGRTIAAALGASLALAAAAWAAAPPLSTTKSIDIDAPAAKVWTVVKEFNGLNTWHPAVAKDEIVEGTNDAVGAVRLLTLKGGGTIKEKLLAYDDAGHSMKYEIVEGVLPVSHYSSTIAVKANGEGKSTMTWTGHYKRKNTGDDPSDKENDKTAQDAVAGVYQGGLDNVKKMAEAK
jgi:mxaD protein